MVQRLWQAPTLQWLLLGQLLVQPPSHLPCPQLGQLLPRELRQLLRLVAASLQPLVHPMWPNKARSNTAPHRPLNIQAQRPMLG